MSKNNPTLKETFATAYLNYKKKDLNTAENICYKILNIDPNHFDSICLLSDISALNRNFDKAKDLLYRAIEIQPKNVSVLNNIGTAYKELGEINKAINFYEKVLVIDSNNTNAHYNLGIAFYKLKDLRKAENYFLKTTEMQTNYAAAFFSLGNVYVDLKEFGKAISSYQKVIEINPNFVGAHNNLGLVFRILNDLENAIKCYEKVIEIKLDHAGAHHNLGMALKEQGKFEKAIKAHETAIKYEPYNFTHHYYLSELKKDILNSELKNKIEKILQQNNAPKRIRAYGNYLLAKYERKEEKYEKELNYLIKGHENFFQSNIQQFKLGVKYCFEDVLQISEGAKVTETKGNKDYEINPIFIIGVPRCGSTLVEKIIVSGEMQIPAGEETSVLENFFNRKIIEKQSLNLGENNIIRKELYNLYKDKGLISKKYQYIFTDKSLNNFFYLNLINSLYPNAKIVHCRRNILSSIMSIFQNNLTELSWTHNLDNIFKYFDNYFKTIENFNRMYPNLIYNLEYEKLVNNPEDETKKLMKYCQLPWSKSCLEFYKRKNLVSKTASNVQIRKAIYKDSGDKYAPYKKLLDKYGKKYSWFN